MRLKTALLSSFAILAFIIVQGILSLAAVISEPGGDDVSSSLAVQNPDELAWRLFLFLNQQAKLGVAGVPDDTKASLANYDPDQNVVWETWALSSGFECTPAGCANQSEVFRDHGQMPPEWTGLPRAAKQPKVLTKGIKSSLRAIESLQSLTDEMKAHGLQIQSGQLTPFSLPLGTAPNSDESRMNRSTFETVRNGGLFSVEGLERSATKAIGEGRRAVVTFERASKEVKARWVHLASCDANPNCTDKSRYHWRIVQVGNAGQVWGLASLHIITKDLPNWVWIDFGHVDCEIPAGTACAGGGQPAETPLRDSTTRATNGVRPETKGSKWEYYRLRGTQTDFSSPSGVPTVLSNPLIEDTFQKSSCITCHSYASVGLPSAVPNRGTSLPLIFNAVLQPPGQMIGVRNVGSQSDDIGVPNCRRFYGPRDKPLPSIVCPENEIDPSSAKPFYLQTDFLWSIPFRARSEKQ